MTKRLLFSPALALAAFLGAQSPAEQPAPQPGTPPAVAQAPAKLDKWPALKSTDADRANAMLAQFRKDPSLHAGAADGLVAIGDAVAPLLFQKVTNLADNTNAQVFGVLDRILGPQHAALLARMAKHKVTEVRRYVLYRLCRFRDADMLPVLQAAAKDNDSEVAFQAALGLVALGRREGLDALVARSRSDWNGMKKDTEEVLPLARGAEPGSWLIELMAKASPVDRAAGLRLMRYLGAKDQSGSLKAYLDNEDRTVVKETVNALRCMNGEQALENLSVFDGINMAKAWKAKL